MQKKIKGTETNGGDQQGGAVTVPPAGSGSVMKGEKTLRKPLSGQGDGVTGEEAEGSSSEVPTDIKGEEKSAQKGARHAAENQDDGPKSSSVAHEDTAALPSSLDDSTSMYISSLPVEPTAPVSGEGKNSSFFADVDIPVDRAIAIVAGTLIVGAGTLASVGAFHSSGSSTAPSAKILSARFSHDTGSSSSDFVTNDATQTISGTLSANLGTGETVAVSVDNGAHWVTATAATGQNNWSVAGQTLTGSNTLKVKVVDGGGHDGAVYSHSYVVDSVIPTAAVISTATINKTGVISGTAEASSTVHLIVASSTFDVATGSDGNWSYTLAAADLATLTQGAGTLSATVTDLAGNSNSSSTTRSVTVDTVAPSTSVTTANFSHDTGISGSDYITNDVKEALSGSLSANLVSGETVYVSFDNGTHWTAATTTVGQSSWSIASQTLSGTNTFKVKVSDGAGNDGQIFSHSYMIDTTAPAAPVISTDVVTSVGQIAGSSEVGSTVHLVIWGTNHDVAAGTDGGWSYTLSAAEMSILSHGSTSTTISATVTDNAGNTNDSAVSHTISYLATLQVSGGIGSQTFVVDGEILNALSAPLSGDGSTSQSMHITGGTGFDTINVSGSNLSFDLSNISSQSASDPGGVSRIVSVEKIDLGDGNNKLNLSLHDLLDMGSTNVINATTKSGLGWTGGSFTFSNSESGHQLIIDGTAGDQVTASGFTDTTQTAVMNGHTYEVYTSTNTAEYAQLLVEQAITRTGIVV